LCEGEEIRKKGKIESWRVGRLEAEGGMVES